MKISGQLAREYATRFPSAQTRTIARMLMRDAPEVYTSYEHARSMVRTHRGEAGKSSRKSIKPVPTTKMLFTMPASDAKPVEPMRLKVAGKGAVISDLHIPYHDQAACEVAVNHAINKGHTDWLIINGDFLDCYQLSRWEKDPRKRRFADELDTAREVLGALRAVFKTIVCKFGNHEVRYESYLRTKAPELIGMPEFELAALLKLEASGITAVKANQVMHIAGLSVVHGHEMPHGIAAPVNPARGLFLRAKASAICGHHHQTSQHSEADIRRKPTSCWSLGCLCELSPEYAPVNKWNHGFALVDVSTEFHVENLRIINGRAM